MNAAQILQDHPEFPSSLRLSERAYALLKQLAYCYENKWLKDNGLISRYKSRRSVADMNNSGYEKVVWNMLKAVFSSVFEGDFPWEFSAKKTGRTRCTIRLSENRNRQFSRYVWADMADTLYHAGSPTAIAGREMGATVDPYQLTRYRSMVVHFNYSNLALFGSFGTKSLEEFRNQLITFREAYLDLMVQWRVWDRPVEDETTENTAETDEGQSSEPVHLTE